jgi:hypothetical protein
VASTQYPYGWRQSVLRVEYLLVWCVLHVQPPEDARPIKIVFNADVSDMMPWKFWPTQPDILVRAGPPLHLLDALVWLVV